MRDQTYFRDRAEGEMKFNLPESHFSKKQALALTCQILAAEGHESGLAGQITARDDLSQHFLTLRFGYGFEEANEELIVQVDDDLKSTQAGAMANPATRFHLWVYRARPDVHAIVHTHPPFTSALTMIGEPLKIGHMDSTMLSGQVAHLKDWPGLPVADDRNLDALPPVHRTPGADPEHQHVRRHDALGDREVDRVAVVTGVQLALGHAGKRVPQADRQLIHR